MWLAGIFHCCHENSIDQKFFLVPPEKSVSPAVEFQNSVL
jgi:hypothetical protein